jgi:uncharacterized protein YndB with AHSA1/START domain
MPHKFEVREELILDATPEQVWEAIATGPGIDAWFMGHSEVGSGVGGRTRMSMPGWTAESTITAWEPGQHFAYQGDEAPDGTFMAFEYLIEGRDGGSTVLRFVHSGFLPDDDWESEYDALTNGDRMYLEKLAVYVKHFAGMTSTYNLFELGTPVDGDRAWDAYRSVFGIGADVSVGDKTRITVPGLEPVDGVVEFYRHPWWVGVRTDDGFYTAMWGHRNTPVLEYSAFNSDVDGARIEQGWQSWLGKTFA